MPRSVVYRGVEHLEVVDHARPVLGDDDVRLAVDACGVCGSDVTSYFKGLYVQPGQVMGHEAVGTVLEAGTGARQRWAPGTRVMVRPLCTCGTCRYCRHAEQHLCGRSAELSLAYGLPGAYAEELVAYGATGADLLVALDRETRVEDAVWAEPLSVSLHALDRACLAVGQEIAVIGAGSVGLSLTAAAAAGGIGVHVVEPRPVRRRLALEAGADDAVEPGALDARFDVVLDTSGVASGADEAYRLLHPGGRLVLIGVSEVDVPLHPGVSVLGAFGYRPDDFVRSAALINRGAVRLGDLVTHRFGLDAVGEAIATTMQDPTAGKVTVVP